MKRSFIMLTGLSTQRLGGFSFTFSKVNEMTEGMYARRAVLLACVTQESDSPFLSPQKWRIIQLQDLRIDSPAGF